MLFFRQVSFNYIHYTHGIDLRDTCVALGTKGQSATAVKMLGKVWQGQRWV